MKLTIHVRRVRPGSFELSPNETVRVLVDNAYVAKRADALTVGDVVASHGVITAVAGLDAAERGEERAA